MIEWASPRSWNKKLRSLLQVKNSISRICALLWSISLSTVMELTSLDACATLVIWHVHLASTLYQVPYSGITRRWLTLRSKISQRQSADWCHRSSSLPRPHWRKPLLLISRAICNNNSLSPVAATTPTQTATTIPASAATTHRSTIRARCSSSNRFTLSLWWKSRKPERSPLSKLWGTQGPKSLPRTTAA